ncbi:hypothetical protein PSTG_03028 [Puccinia striiformis f. sp. tritici PST-78]|uniref:CCHC-type domain-containing protein n=1 Tax=Puccinia striiformis f. sp. tritici PST-78 TaxID=1165861 RepID=A0A0L0VXL0_9BASI|nr:hypothetical protein PSTG_03028 [Puccinia striiformis f. sp. tritici PST-78]
MGEPSLQKQFEDLLKIHNEERALRQQAEADRQAAEASRLIAEKTLAEITANPEGIKLALPDRFDGTRGEPAETYTSQVGLFMEANPKKFSTDRLKVIFCISNLTGPASTWAQPYSRMILAHEEVNFDDFFEAFRGMYFDTEKKPKAEKALRLLKQTKSVATYTHQFAIHSGDSGWEVPTLISQYIQGLKKEIRLGIVYARANFETLEAAASFALKIDNEMSGTDSPHAPSAPQANPNAMDISAFRGQLTDTEKMRMMKAGLCFRCGVKGHLSRDCPEKGKGKEKERDKIRISELEEENAKLKAKAKTNTDGNRAESSKNGGAQE